MNPYPAVEYQTEGVEYIITQALPLTGYESSVTNLETYNLGACQAA